MPLTEHTVLWDISALKMQRDKYRWPFWLQDPELPPKGNSQYQTRTLHTLTGAQLAVVLKKELTLEIYDFIYWTDSTTVQTWLHLESCKYKDFFGTRVS